MHAQKNLEISAQFLFKWDIFAKFLWVLKCTPDLAGGLNSLESVGDGGVGAPLGEVVEALGGRLEEAHLHQEDANHGARPALPSLAVNRDDVLLGLGKPRLDLVHKADHLVDGRHVVVVYRPSCNSAAEPESFRMS